MTLVAGTTLGPYRILEQVGKGGMATVYKAYHAALARNVAIKVLPAYLAEDAVFRERFRAEAITVAKLRHPNILAVHDFGEENSVHYIVTEFVDGGTLADQLGSALPVDYVARMLAPVASALDYAHAREVVHRDVKPSNVLISRDGTPVVSDFGLARMMMGSLPRLTQTGAMVGTPEYMAPEQAAGEDSGPAADRYALAVIAYEMLVGAVPYSADTPMATLIAHLHKPLPLPRERNPRLTEPVEQVLLRGLAKDPGDRFATAGELIRALEAAGAAPAGAMAWQVADPAAGVAPPAPAPAQPRPTPQAPLPATPAPPTPAPAAAPGPTVPGGRSRRVLLAGAAGAVLLAAAGGAWYAFLREPEGPPIYVDVSLSTDSVAMGHGGARSEAVEVTIDYGNGREAVLTDVVIVLRPMRDALPEPISGGIHPERSEEGILLSVGDLGPWAGGQIKFLVTFGSPGSRIVQASIRANELPATTSDTETINVVATGSAP